MFKSPILDLLVEHRNTSEWFNAHVWTRESLAQAGVYAAVVAVSYVVERWVCARLADRFEDRPKTREWFGQRLPAVLLPFLVLVLTAGVEAWSTTRGLPVVITRVCGKFTEAWLVIQLFAAVLLPPGWTRAVALAVGTLFVLELVGVLDHVLAYMDTLALTFSDERISVLEVFQALILLAVMLPVINRFCRFTEGALERVADLNPRVRVLVAKLLKIALYIMAFVAAMDMVGINLQMITVFGGAVGLGIGFGLQKVVSNLVSGVILLLDNSIKPGDVIEVGGAYGWVENMNARYATMVTRDGKAILIPNDEMVSNQVVNWSYTGHSVRMKVPVSVAYDTDLKVAMQLMLLACKGTDRVMDRPKPRVLLRSFGDDGILLELRVWVSEPQLGMAGVASDIQMAIWESFRENGVSFPFPQRDLHLKDTVTVRLEEAPAGAGKG